MHEDHHGQSPAAWTGVAIMLVGAAAACYGVVFGPSQLLWIGLAVALVGSLVWYALGRAGYGTRAHAQGGAHADDLHGTPAPEQRGATSHH